MARTSKREICPECGKLLPRGKERGPCPECGWQEGRHAPSAPSGRGNRARRRGSAPRKKSSLSPLAAGLAIGGGSALVLILLLSLAGKKNPPRPAPPTPSQPRKTPFLEEEARSPNPAPRKEAPSLEERIARLQSSLARIQKLPPRMRKGIKALFEEARRKGKARAAEKLLDSWIALEPADEEAHKLRGDVLYTGPFRKKLPDGTWAWPHEAKSGRKEKIWITKEESRALREDPLYQKALLALRTAKQIDGEQGGRKRYWTWAFFDDDVAPRPFIVFSQSKTPSFAKDRAKSVVRVLSALRESMLADYYEPMHKIHGNKEFLVPIYVFGGEKVYNEFRKRSTIKGLPDPSMAAGFFSFDPSLKPVGWLFVWSENPESSFFKDVISHEGTHLFQYQYGKRTSAFERSDGTTTWFQEGLAEYWGGHKMVTVKGRKIFLPGRIQSNRLQALWRHLPTLPDAVPKTDPRFLPLRRLLRMSYMDYNETYNVPAAGGDPTAREMVSVVYAEGWAFVHFLFHYRHGKYRKALLRYMETELAADFKWHTLERGLGIHGKAGWMKITAQFIDYVRTVLWKAYQDEKSGGFGPWAREEAQRLEKAIEKAEKKRASRRKAGR